MTALPFPDPPLADGLVALRPWRRTDLPRRFAAFDNPACLAFSWPLTEPFTEAHVASRFHREEVTRLRGTDVSLADRLAVHRLELTCAPDNVASRRVAERCGFTCEGVLRAHVPFRGRRRDTAMYSLLPGALR
jgi:hypothetical protein